MIAYMDDLLLLFDDQDRARELTKEIATFLEWLGWTLATEKCEWEPMQEITFLGWKWLTAGPAVVMTASRRTETCNALRQWLQTVEQRQQTPVRALAALLGNLNFLRLQFPDASLHTKTMDKIKSRAVARFGWEGTCHPNPSMTGELKWWLRKCTENRPREVTCWPVSAILTTDASPSGWGASLSVEEEQDHIAFGAWNSLQRKWTSNRKELAAVTMSLRAFSQPLLCLRGTTLQLRSDNTTVVADINRQAAAPTLAQPLRLLLRQVATMQLQLQATHIPGVMNTQADKLSRLGVTREYYLKEEIYKEITQRLQFFPECDSFAATPYLPSDTALEHPRDALRMCWSEKKLFLHPPIHLLSRTIAKVRREAARAIVIAPNWRGQPWDPMLTQLAQAELQLATFEEIMITTPRFKREGWQLPPGTVRAVLLATRTTQESVSSEDY
jgi:ribonuclease HI